MGGEPYWYFVAYEADLQHALNVLREREFEAGRYSPVIDFPEFGVPEFFEQHPGKRHATIREAREESAPDGTRSILDIERVADVPDYGVAAPVPDELLEELYGTARPARVQVESNMAFLEDVERGQCAYVILYEKDAPSEICFAGYSYD
jgi:hypothetical protein